MKDGFNKHFKILTCLCLIFLLFTGGVLLLKEDSKRITNLNKEPDFTELKNTYGDCIDYYFIGKCEGYNAVNCVDILKTQTRSMKDCYWAYKEGFCSTGRYCK